jgi:hypothetical protein
MNRPKPAVAGWAASLTTLAAILAGCSDGSTADATTSPTSSPATSGPSSAQATHAPDRPPRVDKLVDGPLEPGSYALPPLGPVHKLVAVVHIPDGYTHWGPFLNASEPEEPDDPLAISLWVVTGVFKDACEATTQIPAGASVRTLADAFGRQEVTSVTRPRPVTLAGYDGLYLEITAPTKLDYFRCNDAELNFWESTPAGERWTRMPGMRDRLWILDVDGQPMVLAMFVPPSATDQQVDRLTGILKAARFVAR